VRGVCRSDMRILAGAFRGPALSLAIVVAILLIAGGVGLLVQVSVANDEDCGGRASDQIVAVPPWAEIG